MAGSYLARMRWYALLLVGSLSCGALNAQQRDTLRFHSAAFGAERQVIVQLPEFHRYASAEVRMPVIIVLDGQHDWFIEPVLNDIRFLQYTHEVPQAIVVAVPLVDRVKECAQGGPDAPPMPLLRMLTEELPPLLVRYHPSGLSILVGHSFSASFALHAYVQAPGAFDAVIALSPLHRVEETLPAVVDRLVNEPDERVSIAVGGTAPSKDGGHHQRLTAAVEAARIARVQGRCVYEHYPAAGHTSLPVIAFPEQLATLFLPFSLRDSLVPVNEEYQVIGTPPSAEELLRNIDRSTHFLGDALAWEVAEINGILSRLANSGYTEHVAALSRRAIALYPELYMFHAWLGETLLESDRPAAHAAFQRALVLLETHERGTPDYAGMKEEIEGLSRQ